MPLRPILITVVSSGVLFLASCSSGGNQATAPTASPESPSPDASPTETMAGSSATQSTTHGGQGGQVIESGDYHLELVPEKAAEGTHLDFYLQKGETHAPVSDAKVTAQVQLPDGSQKSLEMKYDTAGKHYTVLLPETAPGEYRVAVLSDIAGEKVNGRFSFTK